MKKWIHKQTNDEFDIDDVMCASAARGEYIVNPCKQKFSFYFGQNKASHSIRVKPVFNPKKVSRSALGTLKLCDDWDFIPGPEDKKVKSKDISAMKQFFRDYFVLFSLVWEEQLTDPVVADYFEGKVELSDVIEDIEFYSEYQEELDKVQTVSQLEIFLRDSGLVNMFGNA